MSALARSAIAALALPLFAAGCGAGANDAGASAAADTVGGLAFTTFDGAPASFDEHRGTPLVINFFAEWCPNCIAEMPDFEAVSRTLDGRVDFVGISIDQTPDAGRRLVADGTVARVWSGGLDAAALTGLIDGELF